MKIHSFARLPCPTHAYLLATWPSHGEAYERCELSCAHQYATLSDTLSPAASDSSVPRTISQPTYISANIHLSSTELVSLLILQVAKAWSSTPTLAYWVPPPSPIQRQVNWLRPRCLIHIAHLGKIPSFSKF
jgi:hypothetical protein